ncbi:MAG: hypothetical protein ACFFAS_14835 [Promethearchaeota archaeon]
MKIYLIAIFGVAFIAFFRENPAGAAVILGIAGIGYLFYKSRKNSRGTRSNTLFGGRGHDNSDESLKLLTFIALSKLFEDRPEPYKERLKNKNEEVKMDIHEKAKCDLLKIFER